MTGGHGLTAFLAVAIVAVAGSVLFGGDGVAQLRRLRAERQQLGQAAIALANANHALREQIGRLRHDDLYLESLAREELGLVRPDEIVYRFRRAARPH